jgi:HlyD family secretion protein
MMAIRQSKKWIALILALLLCGAGTYAYVKFKPAKKAETTQKTVVEVKKGEIRSTVSGTSQFEAKDMQNIIAPADGTIKTMNLTRNEAVKANDVLFEIYDPTLEENLQESKDTLAQLQKELADLQEQSNHTRIVAPISGSLTLTANIDVGSSVNKTTKMGTISDTSVLTVKLPFAVEEAVQFKKGDVMELAIDNYLLTKTGKVESVGRDIKADANGNKLVDVEISVTNDGTLLSAMKVKGKASIAGRQVESKADGALEYVNVETFFADAPGNVGQLKFKTGNVVKKGDLIATLTNDTIQDDIVNKQAAVERQKILVANNEVKVNELTIKAPFDGVFSTDFANKRANVLASYPVGAKIELKTLLGAVANLNVMQLAIQVDELDLPNIKTGQKAEVRVDAIPGKVLSGEVSQVSTVGTTTSGVTSYDVVITVNNTDKSELKYGMTATAEILFQDKKDVLVLPIQAMQTQGGKRYVTLQKPDGTFEEKHEVKIGLSSKTGVEVTEGLNAGDKVVVTTAQKQSNTLSQAEIDKLRQQFQGAAGDVQQGRQGGFGGGGNGGAPGGR